MQDYRKRKQAMEARREKRRGKGKTLADLKRMAGDRIAFRQWTEDPILQGNRDR